MNLNFILITFFLRVHVLVLGIDKFIPLAPTNSFGIVGKSVKFKCAINGRGLSWQHKKSSSFITHGIHKTDPQDRRHVVSDPTTGQYDLVITSVQPTDKGAYVCQDSKQNSRALFFAVITTGPIVDVSHKDPTPVLTGSTVKTSCAASYVSFHLDLEITASDGFKTETATSVTSNSLTPTNVKVNFLQKAENHTLPAVKCNFKFKVSRDAPDDPRYDRSNPPPLTITTKPLQVFDTSYAANKVCGLPTDPGMCSLTDQRWYNNAESRECHEFSYRGCVGNESSFKDNTRCNPTCRKIDSMDQSSQCKVIQATDEKQCKLRAHVKCDLVNMDYELARDIYCEECHSIWTYIKSFRGEAVKRSDFITLNECMEGCKRDYQCDGVNYNWKSKECSFNMKDQRQPDGVQHFVITRCNG